MLNVALIMLTAIYLTNISTCRIYEKSCREYAVCENDELMTGIYTSDSYSELERRTSRQDIYVTYVAQNEDFPWEFMTLCTLKDKIPLIIFRPTDYGDKGVDELVSALAGYNKPAFVEIDASRSENAKAFFRKVADKIHLKAPSVAMVWGIGSDRINNLSTLYPGDSYADWVALNLSEKGTDASVPVDPFPVYSLFSYFEKSKPVMLNISLACYSDKGHRYYAAEAAEKVERLYVLGEENSDVKAINYLSTTPDNDVTCCERVLETFKKATEKKVFCENTRLPLLAYNNNGTLYCEKGVIPVEEEYSIINGRRYYKIKNAGDYIFR